MVPVTEATDDQPVPRMGLLAALTPRWVALGWIVASGSLTFFALPSPSMSAALALSGWVAASALALYVAMDRLSRVAEKSRAESEHLALREAESFVDAMMTALPDALVVTDELGHIRAFNPAAVRLFGRTAPEAVDEPAAALLAEPFATRLREDLRAFAATGSDALLSHRVEAMGLRRDGALFPIELSIATMERDGRHRFVLVVHDITNRKQALRRLEVADKVLDCTMEGVMVTNAAGSITWVNQSFCRISGYDRDEVLGKPAGLLRSGLQGPEFYAEMWRSIHATGEWAGEIWNRRKDGDAYPEWLTIRALADSAGNVTRYVGVFSDISKHKRAEETIRTLTYYDAVTRLPNRHLFMDRLAQAIERAQRSDRKAALVLIGLDRFRQINETLGHQTGDALLREVAGRLATSVRGHDSVARLRGDTFCCLLTELGQSHDAHLVISRLLDGFTQSFQLGRQEVFVTASVGISVFPLDGTDPDELVLKAETAMNRSKERADQTYQFYTPEMHANSVERLRLETDLRKALAREEFEVYYQPKIETATGRVVGAEALLRWHHHDLGMISPADFIPIAEETGLIVPIGAWVLNRVCAQIAEWKAASTPVAQIAVNISAHQFRQPDLIERVVEAMTTHMVDPALLELELTESAVMHSPEIAIRTLMELHGHGVRLAVDDFGTGYSSLSYLKKFPLDKLKIDRSFVLDIDTNPASVEIVGAIIAMAHSLNLAVVAEGVEITGQLEILKRLRCDEIQGFYYSRPVPADILAGILRLGRMTGAE